jgi:hypothetical protein
MYARQGKSIFTCSNRKYQFDLQNYLQYCIMPLSADIGKTLELHLVEISKHTQAFFSD